MFEIIALIILSEKISTKARLKGYPNTGKFVFMYLLFWFIFETIGFIIGSIFSQNIFIQYIFALVFAIAGAFIAFKIVSSIKQKEIKNEFDSSIQINVPFGIKIWKENVIALLTITIITIILMKYLSSYMIVFPFLVLIFTNFGIYKIIFENDSIVIKYLYGLKKVINKSQIVRITLNNKLIIELNWKKSSKHTTKVIKFSSTEFLLKNIPLENIRNFFQSTYSNS